MRITRASLLLCGLALSIFARADVLYYYKTPMTLQPWADRYIVNGTSFSQQGEQVVPGYGMIQAAGAPSIVAQSQPRAQQFISCAYVDQLGGVMFPTKDLYVAFDHAVPMQTALAILANEVDGELMEANASGIHNLFLIRTNLHKGSEVLQLAANLTQRSDVRYAQPDMVVSGVTHFIPNDTQFSTQWHLRNTGQSGGTVDVDMQADGAWDTTAGSNAILSIAIDNGMQDNHPDVIMSAGETFTGEAGHGTPATTNDNHGTCVAGCIAATYNNNLGVAGVAPMSRVGQAKPHQMTNASNFNMQNSWVVNALEWSYQQGARITNNSNGYGSPITVISDKYVATYALGMIHFASAGNGGTSTLSYPGSAPNVNSVMSITRTGAKSSFSQYGTGTDFAGPGSEILTTDRTGSPGYSTTGDYVTINGTSFSSPNAAGVCAILLSANPYLSSPQAESIMQTTARDLGTAGYDTTFGYGLVNAQAAALAGVAIRWNGTVTFGSLAGAKPTSVSMFFDLENTLRDRTVTTALTNGAFNIVAPKGAFNVRVSRRPWLPKLISLNNPGVLSSSFSLTNGDADGSGEVDAVDIDYVIARFGLNPTTDPDIYADLDLSGEVDAVDIDIAIANFGAVGT